MMKNPDIDIDFQDRELALSKLQYIPASITEGNIRTKHKSGVYFQNIPTNPEDGYAAYDYERAEQEGYFKIDFLQNHIYEGIRDEDHLKELLDREPNWELFLEEDFVSELAHIRDHMDVLKFIEPTSIEDLAVCLALVRPGKRYLMRYSKKEVYEDIWKVPMVHGAYHYKKSHAIAYAASIVVQLNLLVEKLYDQRLR